MTQTPSKFELEKQNYKNLQKPNKNPPNNFFSAPDKMIAVDYSLKNTCIWDLCTPYDLEILEEIVTMTRYETTYKSSRNASRSALQLYLWYSYFTVLQRHNINPTMETTYVQILKMFLLDPQSEGSLALVFDSFYNCLKENIHPFKHLRETYRTLISATFKRWKGKRKQRSVEISTSKSALAAPPPPICLNGSKGHSGAMYSSRLSSNHAKDYNNFEVERILELSDLKVNDSNSVFKDFIDFKIPNPIQSNISVKYDDPKQLSRIFSVPQVDPSDHSRTQHELFLLKDAIETWKNFVKTRKSKRLILRVNFQKFLEQNRLRLLLYCMKLWKSFTLDNSMAKTFDSYCIQLKMFRSWNQLAELFRYRNIAFEGYFVLKNTLMKWRIHCILVQRMNILGDFSRLLLSRSFQCWRKYRIDASLSRVFRDKKTKSLLFDFWRKSYARAIIERKIRQKVYFSKWRNMRKISQVLAIGKVTADRRIIESIQSQRYMRLRNRFYINWRERCIESRANLKKACDYQDNRLLLAFLGKWQLCHGSIEIQSKLSEENFDNKLLKRIFHKWQTAMIKRKEKFLNSLHFSYRQLNRRKTLIKSFQFMVFKFQRSRWENYILSKLEVLRNQRSTFQFFHRWVKMRQVCRLCEIKAIGCHESGLKCKTLTKWYSNLQSLSANEIRLWKISKTFRIRKLYRYFKIWTLVTKSVVIGNLIAKTFHATKLDKVFLSHWKFRVRLRLLHKKFIGWQVENNQNQCREVFRKWRLDTKLIAFKRPRNTLKNIKLLRIWKMKFRLRLELQQLDYRCQLLQLKKCFAVWRQTFLSRRKANKLQRMISMACEIKPILKTVQNLDLNTMVAAVRNYRSCESMFRIWRSRSLRTTQLVYICLSVHRGKVLKFYYNLWNEKINFQLRHRNLALSMETKFKLRHSLKLWRDFLMDTNLAARIHAYRDKKTCISCLTKWAVVCQRHRDQDVLSLERNQHSIISGAFKLWIKSYKKNVLMRESCDEMLSNRTLRLYYKVLRNRHNIQDSMLDTAAQIHAQRTKKTLLILWKSRIDDYRKDQQRLFHFIVTRKKGRLLSAWLIKFRARQKSLHDARLRREHAIKSKAYFKIQSKYYMMLERQTFACGHANATAIGIVFSHWKQVLAKRRHVRRCAFERVRSKYMNAKKMYELADNFRKQRNAYLSKWRARLTEIRRSTYRAEIFAELNSLRIYVQRWRKKIHFFDSYANLCIPDRRIFRSAFYHWKYRLFLLRNQEQQTRLMAQSEIKLKFFILWLGRTTVLVGHGVLACNYDAVCRKQLVMTKWRHRFQVREKVRTIIPALHSLLCNQPEHLLQRWHRYTNMKKALEDREKIFHSNRLNKSFPWLQRVQKRDTSEGDYLAARYLNRWRTYFEKMQHLRVKKEYFQRDRLLHVPFDRWQRYTSVLRGKLKRAGLFHTDNLSRGNYSYFATSSHNNNNLKKRISSLAGYRRSLLVSSFRKWKERASLFEKKDSISLACNTRLLGCAFSRWQNRAAAKNFNLQRKLIFADTWRRNFLKRRVLQALMINAAKSNPRCSLRQSVSRRIQRARSRRQ